MFAILLRSTLYLRIEALGETLDMEINETKDVDSSFGFRTFEFVSCFVPRI
jgi:hypothetical protein